MSFESMLHVLHGNKVIVIVIVIVIMAIAIEDRLKIPLLAAILPLQLQNFCVMLYVRGLVLPACPKFRHCWSKNVDNRPVFWSSWSCSLWAKWPFRRQQFHHIFVNGKFRISIQISLKFIPKGPIANWSALVHRCIYVTLGEMS